MGTLVIIPAYIRTPPDLGLTVRTIRSVRRTEPNVDVLVVDDGSPAGGLVDELEALRSGLDFALTRLTINGGFSHAVNVGLRVALAAGLDAVLLNADVEIETVGWAKLMRETPAVGGGPAAVVGALLLYPGGELIQHAGVFFSFLTRIFDHRFRFAPATLPDALEPWRCPVTAAFQFIHHECLEAVGVYDGAFKMGYEDVDYCLRVFESGRECVYTPTVRAIHHESVFRGRADAKLLEWQRDSGRLLMTKHASRGMGEWVPEMV